MDSGCLRTGGAVIMGHRRPKPRTIELVKSSYQPTKAELEEEISLEVPGETAMDRLGNLTRAMVQPVNIGGLRSLEAAGEDWGLELSYIIPQ